MCSPSFILCLTCFFSWVINKQTKPKLRFSVPCRSWIQPLWKQITLTWISVSVITLISRRFCLGIGARSLGPLAYSERYADDIKVAVYNSNNYFSFLSLLVQDLQTVGSYERIDSQWCVFPVSSLSNFNNCLTICEWQQQTIGSIFCCKLSV